MARARLELQTGDGRSGAGDAPRARQRTDDWDDIVRTGPGTPMGTLLRRYWQPVALSADIKPGEAIPIRIMSEDLTLYKGESAQPYLIASRCAHRGTVLSAGWVEGESIRCFYHGWKYNGQGQCVEMPAESPDYPPKIAVSSYPAREYAGLVFAYMGGGEPPPFHPVAEMERGYGVQWTAKMIWPCNWFQRLENMFDPVHVFFTHRDKSPTHVRFRGREQASGGESVRTLTAHAEETEWGIRHTASRSADNIRITEFRWPNSSHIMVSGLDPSQPWVDDVFWTVPVDDEHTLRINMMSAPVDATAAEPYRRMAEAQQGYDPSGHHDELFKKRFPDGRVITQAQDYVAQIGQGPIADRTQEHLGASDRNIVLLRKVFRRELDAIKSGSPGKKWQPRAGLAHLPVPPGVPTPDRS